MLKTNGFINFIYLVFWFINFRLHLEIRLLLRKPFWNHIPEFPFLLHKPYKLTFLQCLLLSIHSFIQQTLTGTSLCDYFKWKCYKYKPYHYLPEGQCLHILHFCLFPHCWQPKKIQLYFIYLFSCHLWQIFNLLLNDICGPELACFSVLHTHSGPSMHCQYVCMLIKVPLGNEITCETHFLFSSKLHNSLLVLSFG